MECSLFTVDIRVAIRPYYMTNRKQAIGMESEVEKAHLKSEVGPSDCLGM